MNILLSRTDSIGDVILSLPMAGLIKEKYPHARIVFLGKSYTREVINCDQYIDKFLDWDQIKLLEASAQVETLKAEKIDVFVHVFPNKDIAKIALKAKIKLRIGTSHRLYHFLYCNHLIAFSRKKSDLHEAQLNIKLLKPLGIDYKGAWQQLHSYYGFSKVPPIERHCQSMLSTDSMNIVLHPKSKGSAREWGFENFKRLIDIVLEKGARVFLTGTEEEGKLFRESLMRPHPNLIDTSGKMTLDRLISFIANVDVLVAASTGPLHIAAATGTYAIGIYPPIHPIHPGRWSPIGIRTKVLVIDRPNCQECRHGESCNCMLQIKPEEVAAAIFETNDYTNSN
jgi:ADP-heptose:LPS heptosyltransferase